MAAGRWREWDVEQGSDRVGVVAMRGLTLAGSRIDGTVDARAALGYVEWTFEFANASPIEREARAEIVLPPGRCRVARDAVDRRRRATKRRSPAATSRAARTNASSAAGAIRSW